MTLSDAPAGRHVVTNHFFEAADPEQTGLGSRIDPLARIAAANAMMVAFHRHFGPRRHAENPAQRLPGDETPERVLDIVVLQVPGKGIFEHVGIDPRLYTLELCQGPAMQLGFESRRILRDRLGAYDYYAVVEDDMVIHDPLFFEKLEWFEKQFGVARLLQPRRYEMAQSGTPALVSAPPRISADVLRSLGMRRAGQAEELAADWHGKRQTFALPNNPHVGGFFLSDAQLRHFMSTPWFDDRDSSFASPLESAMSLGVARAFDVYQPAAPDPFFLSIEHWGTRYSRAFAPPGVIYGDPPLLQIAHKALSGRTQELHEREGEGLTGLMALADRQLNALVVERDLLSAELNSLRRSRSKLFKALITTLLNRRR